MKRLIILAATLIAGLSACDSLLDKEPLDRVTQFDYFKTRSDLELFSNPFYDNLLDKTPYDEQNDLLVQMTSPMFSTEATSAPFRTPAAAGRGATCAA